MAKSISKASSPKKQKKYSSPLKRSSTLRSSNILAKKATESVGLSPMNKIKKISGSFNKKSKMASGEGNFTTFVLNKSNHKNTQNT